VRVGEGRRASRSERRDAALLRAAGIVADAGSHPERAPPLRRGDGALLGAIKEAQAFGFTLAEIAEYLRAARRSTAPSEALRVRMAAKIDEDRRADRGAAAHAR